MVRLAQEDLRNQEVLEWQGVHLLHARGSSCSQKLRVFLNLKEIPWESHLVDLKAGENFESWYLGINPRGLVPCLVHDGTVYIESNDIIEYLEEAFPEPPLISHELRGRVHKLLQIENDLHRDLRILTFRYVIPTRQGEVKPRRALEKLRDHNGTINGHPDPQKIEEIRFWEAANDNGITDEQVTESVDRFKAAFNGLNEALRRSTYVLGDTLTIVDIAWYVYSARLMAAGYPLHRIHARVGEWFDTLDSRPEFHKEIQMPPALREASAALQRAQREQGRSIDVLGAL